MPDADLYLHKHVPSTAGHGRALACCCHPDRSSPGWVGGRGTRYEDTRLEGMGLYLLFPEPS